MIMKETPIYLTVTHLENAPLKLHLRPGQYLTLKKDHDNPYDDEAVAVYTHRQLLCGYLANSVHSVARGTCSAGRVYDRIGEEAEVLIRFMPEESLIVELQEKIVETDD